MSARGVRIGPGVAVAWALAIAACGDGSGSAEARTESPGAGGKADGETLPAACRVVDLRDGAPAPGVDPGTLDPNELRDPLAAKVLVPGEHCPETFAATMAKLRETDAAGCDTERAGVMTAVVSEESQLTDSPQFMRSVTSRACDGREPFELLLALVGPHPQAPDLPENAEVIAFDRVAGAFNYYTIEEGEWGFHGSSTDFLDAQSNARCAGCHTGGGLIMKELPNPWVHWEGAATTPGAGELVDRFAELGELGDGAFMELDVVEPGNEVWAETRVTHQLRVGSTRELLRPLFCPVEVNLDTVSDPLGIVPTFVVPGAALADPILAVSGVSIDEASYEQLLVESNSRIEGEDGKELHRPNGDVARDTEITFVFPFRSAADTRHVERLMDRGIITPELATDVLSIDLTRSVFSDARCGLLQFAPDVGPLVDEQDALTEELAQRIREGFVAALEQARTEMGALEPAQAELLHNLSTPDQEATHRARAEAFTDACRGRDKVEFTRDFLQVVSLRRAQARERQVFEFRATMPHDDLEVSADLHFDAQACTLVP